MQVRSWKVIVAGATPLLAQRIGILLCTRAVIAAQRPGLHLLKECLDKGVDGMPVEEESSIQPDLGGASWNCGV